MEINPETQDKKLLYDKIIKLIPNDMLQKYKNELATKETTIPSNEIEEEKNHSEDPNKLLSTMTEQILLESDNQDNDIKEVNIIEKKIPQKEEPKEVTKESLEIIELIGKDKEKEKINDIINSNIVVENPEKKEENIAMNLPNNNTNINNVNIANNTLKTNTEKLIENITIANQTRLNPTLNNPNINPNPNLPNQTIIQKKEREESDEDYWLENPSQNPKGLAQNNNINPNNLPQNASPNKYLAKKRRTDFQDETYTPTQRTTSRRTNIPNANFNQNYNYANNNNNTQIERKNDLVQTNKEKIIISKLIEKKGFLFIFNLLTKPTLSRVDPLEKYFDELIGSVGLLKVALIIFQIYFENQFNSEKSRTMNKREDPNDIMIDIDGENEIVGGNNNHMQSNNFNSMNMPMNNYQSSNYSQNMNPMSYNPGNNYSNSNYNILRNNLTNNMGEPNLYGSNLYNSSGESGEKNVSKYFNNNFSYDQKKSESKRKDNRVSFSLKSTGLSLHFHKDEIGNVYKYSKHHFFGKEICVFYCCDKECRATANYYMNTLRFVLVNKHNKEYNDHIYVKKPDRDRKVMDDLKKRPEHEGQMFKRSDGSKLVKWYDML